MTRSLRDADSDAMKGMTRSFTWPIEENDQYYKREFLDLAKHVHAAIYLPPSHGT